MILVDTSVWVYHLRVGSAKLSVLLEDNDVLVHPFITGELACGNLKNRMSVIGSMQELPPAPMAEHEEVLHLVERFRLWGTGVGWIDVHLLAAALLAHAKLWTLDKHLSAAAEVLGELWTD